MQRHRRQPRVITMCEFRPAVHLGSVGFGGFAALLLRLHPDVASYTIVDLPEVLVLAGRFLEKAGVKHKVRFLNAAPCDNTDPKAFQAGEHFDLALSMYAYGEAHTVDADTVDAHSPLHACTCTNMYMCMCM